jgi:hypothetical protein
MSAVCYIVIPSVQKTYTLLGGYFSGFKNLMKTGKHLNMGFPIAEVDELGQTVLTKEKNTGGCVTVQSVVSQLVYEIQGP